MYAKIMVPVDLRHLDMLSKATQTAGDLSKHYGAPVTYVAVTAMTPSDVAHTPAEFQSKLDAFVAEEVRRHGHEATARMMVSHDPTADLDDTILKAIRETGADLVVMATHLPATADLIWPSNGGTIATHAEVSVFLVRSA